VAISSLLNPGSIARERSTTAEAAQNFITGGSPLGEGVVASAANKIVGFQRGAAGVVARPPDLSGIIQTLSTSILNNVENRVQSINQNVTQVINKTTSGLERDYKERLDKIDSASPNSILQNFLNLYKEALGYIQFLGNRRNVRTLGDNLKALQNVFAETFNVAKTIRQTIIRIVKQLSNLPEATGGAGGLNLDINVPGGGLKKTAPRGLMRMMRRRPGMMLGGAALAGGLGSQVVSGMLDVGGGVQAAPMSEGTIPTALLDRFSGILDRFSAAINSLGKKKQSLAQAAPKQSPPQEKPTKEPGGTPSPGTPGGGLSQDVSQAVEDPNVKAFLDVLAKNESGGRYNVSVGNKTFTDMSKHPEMYNAQLNSDAAGRYQFLSTTYKPIARRLGLKDFSAQSQDLAAVQYLKDLGVLDEIQSGDPKKIEEVKNRLQKSTWTGLRKYSQGQASQYFTERKSYYSKNVTNKQSTQNITNLTAVQPPQTSTKPESKVTPPKVQPSPLQSTSQQQIAQTVAQPPVQQKTQVTVAPMNMASPQTQSTGQGGKSIQPPQLIAGGVSVPFLSPSNSDNFLTLYSKIVYNIIDG
jgi:muramidase (phage lysozyme)